MDPYPDGSRSRLIQIQIDPDPDWSGSRLIQIDSDWFFKSPTLRPVGENKGSASQGAAFGAPRRVAGLEAGPIQHEIRPGKFQIYKSLLF
jgi:hypothetical protein